MVVTTSMNQSFDLWNLFIVDISGSSFMFIILGFIVLTLMIAKLRMPNAVAAVMYILYGLILSAFFDEIFIITIIMTILMIIPLVKRMFNE